MVQDHIKVYNENYDLIGKMEKEISLQKKSSDDFAENIEEIGQLECLNVKSFFSLAKTKEIKQQLLIQQNSEFDPLSTNNK